MRTLGSHGAYSDRAPMDIARAFDNPVVIAFNPGQKPATADIRNGLHALVMEICNLSHADARLRQSDLVLNPVFRRTVDMLDFAARRECVAVGVRAGRPQRKTIARPLAPDATSPLGLAAQALTTPDLAPPDLTVPR